MHGHRSDDGILAVVKPDRSFLHIDPVHAPRQLQRGLDAWAMEGEQGDDRLYVGCIGSDQPVAVCLAEEPHPFIVERDRLDPQGREVVQLVVDVDRGLEHGAIAVLARRSWPVR